MFKITIKSQKEGQFWLEKQTQTEVDEYLAWAEESKHWGSPHWIEEIPEVLEIKDEAGEIIIPARPAYQIVHPAEYSVEVVDVTAEVEQEKVNKECLAYLAETDYLIIRELDNGVKCPEDIKVKRQECRSKIVK